MIGVTALFSGDFHFGILLFLALPLIFIAVGIYFWRQTSTVLVIDKGSGFFYKANKARVTSLQPTEDEHNFKLTTIKALQVIPERIGGKTVATLVMK